MNPKIASVTKVITAAPENFVRGKYWDEILLAVFRDDWLPRWSQFAKEHGINTP